MISLIIKSYFNMLLSIGLGSLCLFILGIYFIVKNTFLKASADGVSRTGPELSQEKLTDLSAIAGDDLMVTQLDLARAYIETDKKSLAKHILESVMVEGNAAQQKEAQHLLNTL